MAAIDLKDAYYSVPVAQEHCKYLRLIWRSKLYQYTCFPNGLSSGTSIHKANETLLCTSTLYFINLEWPLFGWANKVTMATE